MKKISMILALIFILCFFSSCMTKISNENEESSMQSQLITNQESTEEKINNPYIEDQSKMYSIDKEYMQALDKIYSNVEIENVTDQYTTKWKEKMTYYYNLILNYNNKYPIDDTADDKLLEVKKKLTESQSKWEKDVEENFNFQHAFLVQAKETASDIPVLLYKYKYKVYRSRAIELYSMCKQITLDYIEP